MVERNDFHRGAGKDMGQFRQTWKLCKKYLMSRKWWGRKPMKNVPFWRSEEMQPFPKLFQTPVCSRVKRDRKYFWCEIEKTFPWSKEAWAITANTAGGQETWYGIYSTVSTIVTTNPKARISNLVEDTGQRRFNLLVDSKACCLYLVSQLSCPRRVDSLVTKVITDNCAENYSAFDFVRHWYTCH